MQGLLFGLMEEESLVADPGHLVVAGLNVQGASERRLAALMGWCGQTKASVLCFSEVRGGNIGRLEAELRASGYECFVPRGVPSDARCSIIATRTTLTPRLDGTSADGRWLRIRLGDSPSSLSITCVYAPTNGMTAESSRARELWQKSFLSELAAFPKPGLLIGDFNVLEPGHMPPSPFYEPHDYHFYSSILGLGYVDEFRRTSPEAAETSWWSPRFGGQRLDHAFSCELRGDTHATYDGSTVGPISDHSALIITISPEDRKAQ